MRRQTRDVTDLVVHDASAMCCDVCLCCADEHQAPLVSKGRRRLAEFVWLFPPFGYARGAGCRCVCPEGMALDMLQHEPACVKCGA